MLHGNNIENTNKEAFANVARAGERVSNSTLDQLSRQIAAGKVAKEIIMGDNEMLTATSENGATEWSGWVNSDGTQANYTISTVFKGDLGPARKDVTATFNLPHKLEDGTRLSINDLKNFADSAQLAGLDITASVDRDGKQGGSVTRDHLDINNGQVIAKNHNNNPVVAGDYGFGELTDTVVKNADTYQKQAEEYAHTAAEAE